VGQERRHVEADPAGADDGHPAPDFAASQQDLDIGQDGGLVQPRDRRLARHHARGDHHVVEAAVGQFGGRDGVAQPHGHAGRLEPPAEVPQGLGEFFLARHPARHLELAADLRSGLEQRHAMAALGRGGRGSQPRRPAAHDGDRARRARRPDHQFRLVAGARVDQAARAPPREGVIEAGLVAGNAGIDLVRPALGRLAHELGVRQERAAPG
jgi:hypothetical protein